MLLRSLLLLVFLCLGLEARPAAGQPSVRIPAPRELGHPIPGRFIITLQERVNPRAVADEYSVEPEFVYTRVLTGFAGRMSDAARAGLLRDRRVVRVEVDREARVQSTASWGLDRIDQRSLPLNGSYTSQFTGRGVTVYIVDTGIRFDHQEFAGRALPGFDAIGDGRNGSDCNGHGTHVAGTVGGRTYGVAPDTTLVSARVLGCDGAGTMSGVIAALDWIAANAQRPGVANLSLGGGALASVDDAVRRLVSSGIPVVVAGGNSGADACTVSPARVAEALTAGASDRNDYRPSWSNFGTCVDLFAPGSEIVSAWHSGTSAAAIASGTSMAAPHVAGAAAVLLQQNPTMTASALHDAVIAIATKNIVLSSQTPNNHLLYLGSTSGSDTTSGGSGGAALQVGTPGDDRLVGTAGPDELRGEAGNDVLEGLDGDDILAGGDGLDRLVGGPGADRMMGGAANDTYYVDNIADEVTESAGGGSDRAVVTLPNYTLPSEVENARYEGTAGFNGIGNILANQMFGGQSNDTLNGLAGNDVLLGLGGGDLLDGGIGDDTLEGGAGNDRYLVDSGDTVVEPAGGGNDIVYARSSFVLTAGAEVELLAAVSASATDPIDLTGNELNNTIQGNAGPNVLLGSGGPDYLTGLDGNDTIDGGAGSDILLGSAGADFFRFSEVSHSVPAAPDRINDFVTAVDKIDLVRVDANTLSSSDQAFTFIGANPFSGTAGELRAAQQADGRFEVQGDTNGDRVADFAVVVAAGGRALSAGDFIL